MIAINEKSIGKICEKYGEEILEQINKTREFAEKSKERHGYISCFFDELIHTSHANVYFGFIPDKEEYLHIHNFYEFICSHDALLIEYIDGEMFLLEKGEVLILCPGTSHYSTKHGEGKSCIFDLRKEWFEDIGKKFSSYDDENYLSALIRQKSFIIVTGDNDNLFYSQIQKLIDINRSIYRNASLYSNLNFEYSFALALIALTKCKFYLPTQLSDTGVADSRTEKIIEYIVENYNSTTPSLVAAHFGYSVAQLNRIIKANSGKTVSHHLTDERLKHAKLLLLNSNLSVSDIAFEVGFENPECFAKLFKRKRGLTPYRYRKNHPHVGNRESLK